MSVQSVKHKPIIIGITGGIASGKTTATTYLKNLGYPVIDSDQIVSDLWLTNDKMKALVKASFGLSPGDRNFKKDLSDLIFHDEKAREQINKIVHPFVFESIEMMKENYKEQPLIFIDMPLLFEVGYQNQVDHVCLIYIDPDLQKRRLMQRSNISSIEAKRRIESQMSIKDKQKLSDCIFYNHKNFDFLYTQIDQFLKGIKDEK